MGHLKRVIMSKPYSVKTVLAISVSLSALISPVVSAPVFAKSPAATQISKTNIQNRQADKARLMASTKAVNLDNEFAKFAPKAKTSNSVITYDVWDAALQNVVLKLGMSIRSRALRPNSLVGTRMVKGHKSAYRLEGTRVMFSYLNDEYKASLSEYRKDLERIANQVDITRLDKREQLAFWLNLHNVALIEQIALNYPVRRPENLKIGPQKLPLNEAKLLKIRGVDISLQDIREKIVYPNWRDPKVMYGFFRGNIGGPSLTNYAFTGKNLDYVLDYHAVEFVNSLRGFHESRNALKISSIYEEARPFYFKNWPEDLRAHLRKYANPEVMEELESDKPFKVDRYDQVVADLLAGDRPSTADLNVSINGHQNTGRMSPEVMRLLRELEDKTEIMRKRGMLGKGRGTVTIEDIATVDIDLPDVEETNDSEGEIGN